MPRIRSVHPGLFTDEVFMAASCHARILTVGLWTEADDQGVFEWKPLTLKARLLPADAVDMIALLGELAEANVIHRFEHDGKPFGAIRNFRKFQRPQKPTPKHFLPEHLRSYVGLSSSSTVAVEEDYDSATVKPPQMEDEGEGGKRRRRKKDNNTNLAGKNYALEQGCVKLTELDLERWKRAFPHVAVEGELLAKEPWLSKQANWFNAAAGWLAKAEREAMATGPPSKPKGYDQYGQEI